MEKICLMIDCWMGGGTETVVANLAEELTAMNYKVDILVLSTPTHALKSKKMKLNYLKFPKPRKKSVFYKLIRYITKYSNLSLKSFLYKYMYRLRYIESIRILKSHIKKVGGYDLIISNIPHSNFLCIAAKLPNHYSCIHVYDRDLFCSSKMKIYYGTRMIAVSNELRKIILKQGIQPSSIQTIYNIFDFNKIKLKSNEYKVIDKDYIIFVGRLSDEKNITMLIDAYACSGIKQKLLILGDGKLDISIRNNIKSKYLAELMILKGFVPNPYPYIKHAKALVLSSNCEGLPTVLIEALILGTPVVSTSCPTGPKEILTGELADFLSPVSNTDALALNIRKVIEYPHEIKEEHIAKFHKDINLPKYLDLLN